MCVWGVGGGGGMGGGGGEGESACWSDIHNKWFFLPRRASQEM